MRREHQLWASAQKKMSLSSAGGKLEDCQQGLSRWGWGTNWVGDGEDWTKEGVELDEGGIRTGAELGGRGKNWSKEGQNRVKEGLGTGQR